MKVLLTIPPYKGLSAYGENLGLSYIHASIKQKNIAEVKIFNRLGNKSENEILNLVRSFKPDLIGIGVISHCMLNSLKRLLNKIKENHDCIICVGGHYMMFKGRQILDEIKNIDIIVRGEGEEAIIDILNAIKRNSSLDNVQGIIYRENEEIKETKLRHIIENLDFLPNPTREKGLEVYNISASRGCYMTCSFCSVPSFYKSMPGKDFRLRSPASIKKEVFALKDLGATAISFIDDVFLLPGKKGLYRAKQIADIMQEAVIKWAFSCRTSELNEQVITYCKPRGLCNIGLGLESGSESVLKRFNKRASIQNSIAAIKLCRKHDLSIIPYFIMFEPDMSVDDLRINVEFLCEYDLLWPSFARKKLYPYPGTQVFKQLEEQNRLVEDNYTYRAIYKSLELEEIFNIINEPLKEAEKIEYEIRKWEFCIDIQDCNKEKIVLQKKVRNSFKKLSKFTSEFITGVCEKVYDEEQYLKNIESVKDYVVARK